MASPPWPCEPGFATPIHLNPMDRSFSQLRVNKLNTVEICSYLPELYLAALQNQPGIKTGYIILLKEIKQKSHRLTPNPQLILMLYICLCIVLLVPLPNLIPAPSIFMSTISLNIFSIHSYIHISDCPHAILLTCCFIKMETFPQAVFKWNNITILRKEWNVL